MRVFANTERLLLNSWNVGYGNKILHLYFILKYADSINAQPIVACDSSLDDIFDLSKIKSAQQMPNFEIYQENAGFPHISLFEKLIYKLGLYFLSPHSVAEVYERSKKSFNDEFFMLNNSIKPNSDGYLSGHYWHSKLMPTLDILKKYVYIKQDLVDTVDKKYPGLQLDEQHVAVHIRETDFKHHLRHIFKNSIALPDSYYRSAIELAEKNLGSNLTFHLFSDNLNRAKSIFSDKKKVLHTDSAMIDWVGLHLSKSIIQSNSSFCWSASLHNKEYSIQPKGGFNWQHPNIGSIPYDFEMPFSSTIDVSLSSH